MGAKFMSSGTCDAGPDERVRLLFGGFLWPFLTLDFRVFAMVNDFWHQFWWNEVWRSDRLTRKDYEHGGAVVITYWGCM